MSYLGIKKIHTAIDIGTTKICVIIAHEITPGVFDIIGIGTSQSYGMANGVIVDIEKAAQSIITALNQAQEMASFEVESAYIGVSGSHIKSYYSQGMSTTRQNIVKTQTVNDALDAAKAISLPEDHQILHVIPLKYIIDGFAEVENPVGMHAMRLEVGAHIITGSVGSIQNLITACSIAGISVNDVVLEPIASACALLNEQEKYLGALLIDIGGGTSDVALYRKGSIEYTHILPIAGNIYTNDLAICLQTTLSYAEELKKQYGMNNDLAEESVTIPSINDSENLVVSSYFVQEVLHARAIEFAQSLKEVLEHYKINYPIPSGIVLTGGGALLKGLDILIQNETGYRTRIGIPHISAHFKGSLEHPSFATAYGLLLYAAQKEPSIPFSSHESLPSRLFWKMKSWLEAFV